MNLPVILAQRDALLIQFWPGLAIEACGVRGERRSQTNGDLKSEILNLKSLDLRFFEVVGKMDR